MRSELRYLLAFAAGYLTAGYPGSALCPEIVADYDGPPLENSEFIATLIDSCITETRKSWFAPSVREAVRTCSMRVHGLTLEEYRAFNCLPLRERPWIFDLCASAKDKKLRPLMVPDKASGKRQPEHPVGLTAPELAALEAACDMVRDAGDNALGRLSDASAAPRRHPRCRFGRANISDYSIYSTARDFFEHSARGALGLVLRPPAWQASQ
jgi:hypothetical protein